MDQSNLLSTKGPRSLGTRIWQENHTISSGTKFGRDFSENILYVRLPSKFPTSTNTVSITYQITNV